MSTAARVRLQRQRLWRWWRAWRFTETQVPLQMPWWMLALLAMAVLTIVISEYALTSVSRMWNWWPDAMEILDLALIGSFAIYVLINAAYHRDRLRNFAAEYRWDVFFLAAALVLLFEPRVAALSVITRVLINTSARILDTSMGRRLLRGVRLKPTQTLALSFIGLITFSSILLMFPAATVDGQGASFTDAMFTITSSACVTGLAVKDTGTYFTSFGQGVILLTIQIGGLGITVLSAMFALLLNGRLLVNQQSDMGQVLDANTDAGIKWIVKSIAGTVFLAELLGTIVLFFLFQFGLAKPQAGYESAGMSLWWSFFHAISAFNNAGFALAGDSLTQWASNPWMCGVIGALITVGGIGFAVMGDLYRVLSDTTLRTGQGLVVWMTNVWEKRVVLWGRLQLHTKVVLAMSLLLNMVGGAIFMFLEYEHSMAHLSVPAKVNAALFQAVSLRTAGFNSIDFSLITAPTIVFSMIWMFVGASPGSTGGGVKTTTTAVVIMSIRSMLQNRADVEIFGRSLPPAVVYRSISLVFISGVFVALGFAFLAGTQKLPFERLAFEVLSAFGTVGLSMNTTGQLDGTGKWIVIGLMYIGRVGPLTLALAVGERLAPRGYRYPTGQLPVG